MNSRMTRIIAKIIAIVLIAALVITSFSFVMFLSSEYAGVYGAAKEKDFDLDKELEYLKETIINVDTYYKDDISLELLMKGAFQGIFESLDDPYSVYFESREESDDFIESVSGEFGGIGVSLEEFKKQCRIASPISGSPAEKAGLMHGDIITEVDGVSVSGMTVESVASMIRGEEGTGVVLEIDRNGKTLTFTIIRDTIRIASVNFEMLEDNIGYIQITQFDTDSHIEFKNAKLQLITQGARSFIVDIRNNAGGYTAVAASVAEQFMPEGPITHFSRKGQIVETANASGQGDLGMPIVLLINKNSASASEILAGAWQDSNTAVLVGTTTFGKGIAQQVIDLSNGSSMKLSVLYFLTPNENNINKTGITPDHTVEDARTADSDELMHRYKDFAPMTEKEKPAAGSTGLNVYGAQQRLSLIGYKVEITGTMDDQTVKAVKSFQESQGLYSYGVLDYSTMDQLDKAAASFVRGAGTDRDLQLEKAVELLSD